MFVEKGIDAFAAHPGGTSSLLKAKIICLQRSRKWKEEGKKDLNKIEKAENRKNIKIGKSMQ